MIIDDGSTDQTIAVAKAAGRRPHRPPRPQPGASRARSPPGIEAALRAGADVIVNTDADNQYRADDIPKLTAPILAGEADLVIGARPIVDTPHFSRTKKALQLVGSMVVRMASRTQVVDAPSGFRALSRAAARAPARPRRVHLHARDHHRRRPEQDGGDLGADPDQPGSAALAPGQERARLRAALGDHHPAQLRHLQAAALLLRASGCCCSRPAASLGVRYLYFARARRRRRPRPVGDPERAA